MESAEFDTKTQTEIHRFVVPAHVAVMVLIRLGCRRNINIPCPRYQKCLDVFSCTYTSSSPRHVTVSFTVQHTTAITFKDSLP